MKTKHMIVIFLAVIAAMLLSGCASGALASNSWPGLATDGEVAYLAEGQYVYAVSLTDGKEIWHYPEKADSKLQFLAQPAVTEDGTVIIGSMGNDFSLVALDTSSISPTGVPQEKWIFTGAKDRWIGAPLVIGEKVFAPNVDGYLYILDMQGSATKQSIEAVELGGRLWAQPVADESKVYVSSLDHRVHSVDLQSYKAAWMTDRLGGAIPGSPLLGSNGDLFVGTFKSELVRVNTADGKASPFVSVANWVWSAPVAEEGNIYFGDLGGNFYAVDSTTGDILWSIQPDGPIVGSPLVMTDFIVFATESGSVYAVDRDGKILWTAAIGGKIYTTPVSGKDRIVVAPMETDFKLAILDTNGNQISTFAPGN